MSSEKVTVFSGVSGDLRPWIAYMEFGFSLFKNLELDKLSWAKLFMDGTAKEYVKRLERISPFKSWHEMKYALLLVFGEKDDPDKVRLQIESEQKMKRWMDDYDRKKKPWRKSETIQDDAKMKLTIHHNVNSLDMSGSAVEVNLGEDAGSNENTVDEMEVEQETNSLLMEDSEDKIVTENTEIVIKKGSLSVFDHIADFGSEVGSTDLVALSDSFTQYEPQKPNPSGTEATEEKIVDKIVEMSQTQTDMVQQMTLSSVDGLSVSPSGRLVNSCSSPELMLKQDSFPIAVQESSSETVQAEEPNKEIVLPPVVEVTVRLDDCLGWSSSSPEILLKKDSFGEIDHEIELQDSADNLVLNDLSVENELQVSNSSSMEELEEKSGVQESSLRHPSCFLDPVLSMKFKATAERPHCWSEFLKPAVEHAYDAYYIAQTEAMLQMNQQWTDVSRQGRGNQQKCRKTWKFKFKKRKFSQRVPGQRFKFTEKKFKLMSRVDIMGEETMNTRWMKVAGVWFGIWRTLINEAAIRNVKWNCCLYLLVVAFNNKNLQEGDNAVYRSRLRHTHTSRVICKMRLIQPVKELKQFALKDGKFQVKHKWRFKSASVWSNGSSHESFSIMLISPSLWASLSLRDGVYTRIRVCGLIEVEVIWCVSQLWEKEVRITHYLLQVVKHLLNDKRCKWWIYIKSQLQQVLVQQRHTWKKCPKTWMFKYKARIKHTQALPLHVLLSLWRCSCFVWHRWRSKDDSTCPSEMVGV
ncbi:unnamed protein product [Brassica napus]|uniref:(rape) hypothetical protein n=1 Tax=Brassica napus TaxID=3708 RepID=A0A816NM83_BRANA|nr:unnamed protein product [Brassica napus]